MVTRILTPYYFLGQDSVSPAYPISRCSKSLTFFQQDFPPTNYNTQGTSGNQHVDARSEEHTTLIKDIANAGAVLLKNTNVLPLSAASPPKTIAVIGLDAAITTGCMLNECDGGTLSVGCALLVIVHRH